ncbi:hypothetical protein BDF14DRAFT_1873462 [Spinellus fusiger]|nr:hypothetical protein BDF14DRAFT_1873462 [Spinellus fusiger]
MTTDTHGTGERPLQRSVFSVTPVTSSVTSSVTPSVTSQPTPSPRPASPAMSLSSQPLPLSSSSSSSPHGRPLSPVTAPLPPPHHGSTRLPAASGSLRAETGASIVTTTHGYRPLNVKDALTYLDQVKLQFSDQPEVYNKFLDIMKDFKSQAIDTPGVIERVSGLFKGHPSLISGFNTFLPPGYRIECSTDERLRDVIKVTTPSGVTRLQGQAEEGQGRRPPVEFNHAINYVNKIKNRFANDPETYKQFLEILQMYQKEQKPIQEVYAQVQLLFDGANDLLDEFKQFLPDASGNHSVGHGRKKRGGSTPGTGMPKRSKLHHKMVLQTSDVRSGAPPEEEMIRPVISTEEADFFERVRKYIGNKTTYSAFLKVLNLFSQQIVDQNLLVNRVESFIGGNKELFDWFKSLVGYDGKDEIIENVPADKNKPDLAHCKTCGPSYRLVPKTSQACSGRDSLCWEVLNDEYVSHPTWASEDNGSVASKKNQYEEALNRVEEERYDYDLNIEANLNTIALLEPIVKKMINMTAEEKTDFRLLPGLGGSSQTIYQRILKKIYGGDRGLEIIELLHENPVRTVPIVLKRLKQKDDEWKRAQREWNKIWREVEAKNYWKSLDYQGITFKSSDRKAITVKVLVAEIEALRKDQIQGKTRHSDTTNAVFVNGRQGPQMSFALKDKAIFKDIYRLVFSFLERQNIYTVEECDQIRSFIETFVPLFFDVADIVPDTVDVEEEEEEEEMEEGDESRSLQSYDSDGDLNMSIRGAVPRRTRTANRAMSKLQTNEDEKLLKDVLTRNITCPPHTRQEMLEEEILEESKNDMATEVDVQLSSGDEASPSVLHASHRPMPPGQDSAASQTHEAPPLSPGRRLTSNFFSDTSFYCFFRLIQMAYARLEKLKVEDAEYKLNPGKEEDRNKIALDLGAISRKLSGKAIPQSMRNKMGLNKGHYHALLNLIDKFFEEDMDQQQFEESARYVFGTKAYVIFTIDKLILTLIRHIHHIVTKDVCRDLVHLFKKEHQTEATDIQSIKMYRLQVEDMIGSEDNVYNLVFDTSNLILSIQILSPDDVTYHEAGENNGYEEYVASYIDWTKETEGILQSDLTPRFLRRNTHTKLEDKDLRRLHVHSRMQYKICRNTYHLFYIIGTEDTFAKFKAWLESGKGWCRDVENKEEAEAKVRRTLFQP